MGERASGLEGVVVAETRLSDVDGAAGRLVIAGRDVEDLAGREPFEAVYARLMGRGADWTGTAAALGQARARAWELVAALPPLPLPADGMAALRASCARLETDDPTDVVAAVAVFAAANARRAAGLAPLAPEPGLGHAADYLRMVSGEVPTEAAARAADAYFVTVVDHGMNASTFAARVIASTGSDLVSAVTGAIGALKGPLHGGAPGEVSRMLDAIGVPDRAEAWLRAELDAGRRIMGMGHRVYRVRDPRAAVLEREISHLERTGVRAPRLALARAVEEAAERLLRARHPDRPLRANVEFYTAVLLDTLGVPRAAFSPTFAASRSAGWCAHVAEQRAGGRLIRPSSRYVGAMPPNPRAMAAS